MPKESIQHLYNLPGPWGWEKMQTYRNEKLSPSPLTAYSADRLTAIGLVWIILFSYEHYIFASKNLFLAQSSRSAQWK